MVGQDFGTDEVTSLSTVDDAGGRAGSAPSLMLSVVGLYQRRLGGSSSTSTLVRFAAELGVAEPLARTAVARLKKRGVLAPERVGGAAGYRLTAAANQLLERGDRRILSPRNMTIDELWCVVTFSVPESERLIRSQLRRRLSQIGCGMIFPGVWVCPDFLRPEVERILLDLDARRFAVVFQSPRPLVSGSIEHAIGQWWDLRQIARMHTEFTTRCGLLLAGEATSDGDAFRRYVTGVDAWREVSYLDPGLPYELLPARWPGRESARLFRELSWRFAEQAWSFTENVALAPPPRS